MEQMANAMDSESGLKAVYPNEQMGKRAVQCFKRGNKHPSCLAGGQRARECMATTLGVEQLRPYASDICS
jgi:hypothetical protein